MNIIHRDRDIFRLYRSGMSMDEIAKKLGIYYNTVRWVICGNRIAGEREERGKLFRQKIHDRNDLNRKWHVGDLLDSLRLYTRTRTALILYYDQKGVRRISLKEFMDLIVPENPIPDHLYGCTAVMKIRNIGRKGFWLILDRLSTLDLGENTKREWKRKLATLKRYGRKRDLPRSIMAS